MGLYEDETQGYPKAKDTLANILKWEMIWKYQNGLEIEIDQIRQIIHLD